MPLTLEVFISFNINEKIGPEDIECTQVKQTRSNTTVNRDRNV